MKVRLLPVSAVINLVWISAFRFREEDKGMTFDFLKSLEQKTRRILHSMGGEFSGTTIKSVNDALTLQKDCRILLLRIDKLGDMLVTFPLLRELRKKFPKAQIDVILGKGNKGLANAVKKYANSVLFYDKTILGLLTIIKTIRANRYDVCIDPLDNPSITSGNLCKLSGAKHTVGICKENAHKYIHCVQAKDRLNFHIVERTAQLLLAFGIDPQKCTLDCEYHIKDEIISKGLHSLSSVIDIKKPMIAINVAGSSDSRTMNAECGANIYRAIHSSIQSTDAQIVLLGPHSHKNVLDEIHAQTQCIIAPYTQSFEEYASMLKCASIIVSPDTSAVHLAASWKTPTVCLFCLDNTGTALWTPYNTVHKAVISNTYNINDINVSKVCEGLNTILQHDVLSSVEVKSKSSHQ
jgi:ADP-heptose:LPS heptosyltransferase